MDAVLQRLLICLSIFLHGASLLFAQQPAYLHYGVSDGLPSALVYDVIQDSKGFIWCGTDKGLVRFDGTRFKVFTTKHGLPDNDVLALHEDKLGRLWLSCFQNNPCFLQDGIIHTAENDSLLAQMNLKGGVFTFSNADNGDLWITGDPDKYCKISPNNQLECHPSPVEAFNAFLRDANIENSVITVEKVVTIDGKIFVFGQNSILDVTNQDSISLAFLFPGFSNEDEFISIAQNGNNLFVCSKQGIYFLNYSGSSIENQRFVTKYSGGLLKIDRSGNPWSCTQRYGAVKYSLDGSMEVYLNGKKITNMHEDREGNLWFSTLNEGIYMLPRNASVRYSIEDGLPFQSNNFVSISTSTSGGILVGDDSGNLYQYQNQGKWRKHSFGSHDGYNRVLKILPFPNGKWLALSEEGFILNDKGKTRQITFNGAPKSACYLKGGLWVGTSSYLLYSDNLDDGEFQRMLKNRTTAICADADSLIWVGGLNGIYSQKDQFNKNWGEAFETLATRITDIKLGGENLLWVASAENGLLKVEIASGTVKKVEVINEILERPIENVQNIFPFQGGVWLSTNTGAYFLNKEYHVKHLNENNGLISNNVNAIVATGDTLWVATVAGISSLLLNRGRANDTTHTYITELRYRLGEEKKSLDFFELQRMGKSFVLPAEATMLEIDLSALHFRTRGNLQFEVSTSVGLLPFHQITWENLIAAVETSFGHTYLELINSDSHGFGIQMPPGRYSCRATAILPNGIRSAYSDYIDILAKPFWWQVIWFHLGLAMLVGFAIWRFFKERENFLRVHTKNAELQLQAIRSQMNPHFVGNSINAIQQFFYPPDPVKASEYISMFSDLLRRTMYFSETDFIHFEDEMNYIKDYLEMIRLRFGDRFEYQIEGVGGLLGETPFPAMILQPILENATIHGLAPEGKSVLKVKFNLYEGVVTCQVTDNGVGINTAKAMKERRPSRGKSKGLLLLSQKAKTLNSLYPLDLQFKIEDITKTGGETGTKVSISFRRLATLPNMSHIDIDQPYS